MKKNLKSDRLARRVRLGALGRMLAAIACAALVYVGMWALTEGGARLDLTFEGIATLSEGTLQTLEDLESPVTFHLIFEEGTQNSLRTTLETLAQSYADSGKVTVDAIDPIAEPGRISPYQTSGTSIPEGSVVVTNADGSRFEVVNAREMYTYAMTTSGAYTRTGISAEQKLTAAVRSVSGAERVNVYFLTGHQEAASADCTSLVSRLEGDNYAVSDLSLQGGAELMPGDVLMVLSPVVDLTDEEYASITAFLDGGGRLFYALDATVDLTAMPNFERLATRLSLNFETGIIVEDEGATDYWMSSPLYLMPGVNAESAAASGMGEGDRVIVPGSRSISGPEIPLSGYTYEPLLTTSQRAYRKQTDSAAFTREEGDPTGTQQIAVSISHVIEDTDREMRAVLMGTLYTVVDNSLLSATSNLDLTASAIGFLAEREDAVSVPVREIGDTTMSIPSAATAMRILCLLLALPLGAVIVGAIVIVRRRRA